MNGEDIKTVWKGITPSVLIMLVFFCAFIWVQYAVNAQHMQDYERVATNKITELHNDIDDLAELVVTMQISNAELKTRLGHIEEQLDRLLVRQGER